MSAFYQHKSGAQKSHEKEQQDKETQKGSHTMFQVIKASSSPRSDRRPTIPEVVETIGEESEDGNHTHHIEEQCISGTESEMGRDCE